MKITRLDLLAYGPFTDVSLDLESRDSDFHLMFGPNEAGKSSSLRALRNMLFGIPARTPDNFIHGYPNLRIGAGLVRADGSKLEFIRRKGKAGTLRGTDDETVLDDDLLIPFLGGVDREIFEHMFAIGHDDLIRGGEEIVSGRGRIGEALFSAGAGLIRLQAVQQNLAAECGALFKPGGSAPVINKIIADLKAVRKNQREALLPAKTWQEHDRALGDAEKRMVKVQEELREHRQRGEKLRRIREALPLIVRKNEIEAGMLSFAGVPDLPEDFGRRRRKIEKDHAIALGDLHRVQGMIEELEQRIEKIEVPRALIEHAPAIEALQHELGSFRKAEKDRPDRVGRMRTLQQQADEKLAELEADLTIKGESKPRLHSSAVGEIQNLGKEFQRLTVKRETFREQRAKLKSRCSHVADQLKSLPVPSDVTILEAALHGAREAGPIEKRVSEMAASIKALEKELSSSLKRQSLWTGSLAEIDTLSCPSQESVERFEKLFDESQRRMEKCREDKAEVREKINGVQTELRAMDRVREVPTESDLKDSRVLRDRGWSLIRHTLEGEEVQPSETGDFLNHFRDAAKLPDAFEKSMTRADHIADRLRREAEQVSRKGLLEAEKKSLEKALAHIDEELDALTEGHDQLEGSWKKLWVPAGIKPLSPGEMRPWIAAIALIREKLAGLHSLSIQAETSQEELALLKSDLVRALNGAGLAVDPESALAKLIKIAQDHVNVLKDQASRIAQEKKLLTTLEGELEEVNAEAGVCDSILVRWKTKWEHSVKKIGLNGDIDPTAALTVIDGIREAQDKIDKAEELRKRIKGIDRDGAAFKARVDELVTLVAPDLKGESRSRAAELLNAGLTAARKADSKRQSLEEQRTAGIKEKNSAEKRIIKCRAGMESLCREAKCSKTEDLEDTEQRARLRQDLIREREGLEERLRKLSAGASVDQFIDDASSVEADGIAPELEELDNGIRDLEQERSLLDQTIGREKTRLKEMDGSSRAAGYAEEAQGLLASMDSAVEQYARLKIASAILAGTVEQYREKHQGPLISRAGDLFARMTLGAFDRLRADYDEKGSPILVGIRAGSNTQVTVQGMSDGTADQLYLALRLAGLEQYLADNEPIPFVVDDILLRFDDERALATLGVLAELASKTQVLFFTHHHHLIELARDAKEISFAFNVHRL